MKHAKFIGLLVLLTVALLLVACEGQVQEAVEEIAPTVAAVATEVAEEPAEEPEPAEPEEGAADKGIDNAHLGQGNSKGPAHVAPCDVWALFRSLKKNSTGRIYFSQTGMWLDKTDCHPL